MINSLTSIDKENVNMLLDSVYSEKSNLDNEKAMLESKKETIEKNIETTKETIGNNPKPLREYEKTYEGVLASIEFVRKNLDELQCQYASIEDISKDLLEQYENNINNQELENELIQRIDNLKTFEGKIKQDHEKHYLIIDNFLNNQFSFDDSIEVDNSFYNLTLENLKDNLVLKICEKRVELPYTKKEVEDFMREYPNDYKTVQDVITKEFMVNISLFNRHPILSRFKEAYYLCRTKEMMPIFESLNYAKEFMFKSEINPYIIAAVKSKKQLEEYVKCLQENRIDDYSYFKIWYEIKPLTV